jgi:hypothetical protein
MAQSVSIVRKARALDAEVLNVTLLRKDVDRILQIFREGKLAIHTLEFGDYELKNTIADLDQIEEEVVHTWNITGHGMDDSTIWVQAERNVVEVYVSKDTPAALGTYHHLLRFIRSKGRGSVVLHAIPWVMSFASSSLIFWVLVGKGVNLILAVIALAITFANYFWFRAALYWLVRPRLYIRRDAKGGFWVRTKESIIVAAIVAIIGALVAWGAAYLPTPKPQPPPGSSP